MVTVRCEIENTDVEINYIYKVVAFVGPLFQPISASNGWKKSKRSLDSSTVIVVILKCLNVYILAHRKSANGFE